jgi:hypothetical protein
MKIFAGPGLERKQAGTKKMSNFLADTKTHPFQYWYKKNEPIF